LTLLAAAFFYPSDEEVLPIPNSDPDSSDNDGLVDAQNDVHDKSRSVNAGIGTKDVDEDDDLAGWGDSKRDYYNADPIETEADALEEEKEALRLQKKQLQGMKEADYGFDEVDWLEGGEDLQETGKATKVVQEILPDLLIPESMTKDEKLNVLSARYPEFEPLSREFVALQDVFENLDAAASKALQPSQLRDATDELPSLLVKQNILASYLGSLAMYFSIFSSGSGSPEGQIHVKPPSEIRKHPIMETLVATRSMWEKVKDMSLLEPAYLTRGSKEKSSEEPKSVPSVDAVDQSLANKKTSRPRKSRKSKEQMEAENALQEAAIRRAERMQRVETELAKLGASAPFSATTKAQQPPPGSQSCSVSDSESDFGEAEALTAEEAERKARRKRGLRFYTSKITAKSLKRDRATRDGGDTDIPYRERLRDRQARLNAAAEKRGLSSTDAHAALDAEADSDEEDRAARSALRDVEKQPDDEEDYYDLVAAHTQRKKEAKAVGAAVRREARITGRILDDGETGTDGKREITYAIAKNKGLTPKRKKEGRNPRVKKRNRYEEKKKKLGSVRAVYKGGEGRGGYGGEKTGIRKNLVKSVKL
jgi:U3 small nucleolar RNA-associated protein 3